MTDIDMSSSQRSSREAARLLLMLVISGVVHLAVAAIAGLVIGGHKRMTVSNHPEVQVIMVNADSFKSKSHLSSTTQKSGSGSRQQNKNSDKQAEASKQLIIRTEKQSTQKSTRKMRRKQVSRRSKPTRSSTRRQPDKAVQARANSGTGDSRPPQYRLGSAFNPVPVYPYLARKRGWQGRVAVKVTVDKSGNPVNINIARSSGYQLLDKAAVNTIFRWRFKPSLRFGKPVQASITVPFRFQLTGTR